MSHDKLDQDEIDLIFEAQHRRKILGSLRKRAHTRFVVVREYARDVLDTLSWMISREHDIMNGRNGGSYDKHDTESSRS